MSGPDRLLDPEELEAAAELNKEIRREIKAWNHLF
jgi:hypothetical protein